MAVDGQVILLLLEGHVVLLHGIHLIAYMLHFLNLGLDCRIVSRMAERTATSGAWTPMRRLG
jgi:hypothetical protein